MDDNEKQEIVELLQKNNSIIGKLTNDNEILINQVEKQKEQLKTWNAIKKKEREFDIKQAADTLELKYKKNQTLGQNLLFEFLRYCDVLIDRPGTSDHNQPKHRYMPKYFTTTLMTIDRKFDEYVYYKTIVKADGLDFIKRLYEKRGEEWKNYRSYK